MYEVFPVSVFVRFYITLYLTLCVLGVQTGHSPFYINLYLTLCVCRCPDWSFSMKRLRMGTPCRTWPAPYRQSNWRSTTWSRSVSLTAAPSTVVVIIYLLLCVGLSRCRNRQVSQQGHLLHSTLHHNASNQPEVKNPDNLQDYPSRCASKSSKLIKINFVFKNIF